MFPNRFDMVRRPFHRRTCPRGENMRRLLGFLLMSVLLPTGVSAQEHRPYIVMSGLLLALVESDGTYADNDGAVATEFDMDAGYGATLAFGFGAAPGLSGEIEVGYRATDLSGFEDVRIRDSSGTAASIPGSISATGDLSTLSLMVNGYYTFDTRVFRPYVGVGVGLAQHEWKNSGRLLESAGADVYVPQTSDDDAVLAYQFMVGLNWAFADNTEARAGYRYFATTSAKFDGVKAGYATHNIDAGLIIRF